MKSEATVRPLNCSERSNSPYVSHSHRNLPCTCFRSFTSSTVVSCSYYRKYTARNSGWYNPHAFVFIVGGLNKQVHAGCKPKGLSKGTNAKTLTRLDNMIGVHSHRNHHHGGHQHIEPTRALELLLEPAPCSQTPCKAPTSKERGFQYAHWTGAKPQKNIGNEKQATLPIPTCTHQAAPPEAPPTTNTHFCMFLWDG